MSGSEHRKQLVFVFGNPDYAPDALPLKILPELKKRLINFQFEVIDPNEDFPMPEKLIIIDTVQGIKEITIFNSLDQFADTPNLTMHDFDLGMKLKWLAKLKKLPEFTIIGIPMGASENIIVDIEKILTKI